MGWLKDVKQIIAGHENVQIVSHILSMSTFQNDGVFGARVRPVVARKFFFKCCETFLQISRKEHF